MQRSIIIIFSIIFVYVIAGCSDKPESPVKQTTKLQELTVADISIPLDDVQGAAMLSSFTGTPDTSGVLKRFTIELPPFSRAVYFNGSDDAPWPHEHNRCKPWYIDDSFADVRDGGLFTVLELTGGGYLALVPVAGDEYMTWFGSGKTGGLDLLLGTLGTEPFSGDCALMAWARDDDLYTACYNAWHAALKDTGLSWASPMRYEKDYPEVFNYLGWCSWEEYHYDITADLLIDSVDRIESSDVPIRFMLVDDGHLDAENYKMISFHPNEKFPDGWGPLLNRRNPDGIRWMGVWFTLNGYWRSIRPENELGELNDILAPTPPEQLPGMEPFSHILPKDEPGAADTFFEAFMGTVAGYGFDFVKIDNQTGTMHLYQRGANGVRPSVRASRAMETVVDRKFGAMINCQSHTAMLTFNRKFSVISRVGNDYRKGNIDVTKGLLRQCYANNLWTGQTCWGDFDMYHSSDATAAREMAISKAMSGGPIYISDAATDFVPEHILPLCYADGELIRTSAPAVPLPGCVFADPVKEAVSFRTIAPLPGGAASVCCYNLTASGQAVQAGVSAADYALKNAMVQPPEPVEMPEQLVYYNWQDQTVSVGDDSPQFSLDGFGNKLIHICPVESGWAVIGRPDKYLSPATVDMIDASENTLNLRMIESGPLMIWSESAAPQVDGYEFRAMGNGLYLSQIPVGARDLEITITR